MQTIPRRAASGVNVQLECKSRYNVKSFHAAIAETIRVHGRIFYAFRLVLVLNIQGTFFNFPLAPKRLQVQTRMMWRCYVRVWRTYAARASFERKREDILGYEILARIP